MNEKLMQKYRTELNNWSTGEKYVFCYDRMGPWYQLNEDVWIENRYDESSILGMIPDDEYIELRKAEFSGKEIEQRPEYSLIPWKPKKLEEYIDTLEYRLARKSLNFTEINNMIQKHDYNNSRDTILLANNILSNAEKAISSDQLLKIIKNIINDYLID